MTGATLRHLGITSLALVLSSLGACGGSAESSFGDGADSGSGGSGSGGTANSSAGDDSGSDSSSSSSSDGNSTSSSDGDSSSSGGDGDTSSSAGDSTSGSGGSSSSNGTSSGASGGVTAPIIPGGGENAAPLGAGCGPETASQCHPPGGDCAGAGFTDHEVKSAGAVCFFGEGHDVPSATVEHITEVVDGQEYIHLRVTFDPDFVDTAYGECSPDTGWPRVRGHWFSDLVKSDHVELILSSCAGDVAMHFKLDFISEDAGAPCGYGSLGAMGGDGAMVVGDPDHILAATSSLDRNMNGCGYCDDVDSPCTDSSYAPDPETPEWDFRMVYEVWLDPAAFGSDGFCDVDIDYVHASPAKSAEETIIVEPKDCPPGGGTGGTGGTGGSGGNGGNGGSGGGSGGTGGEDCPPDYELILTSEGEYFCEGPPGDDGLCPDGYVIDLTSEGERCISENPVQ